ncbi:MAG: hypothetical protein HUU20_04350 [Pirellulales bacterium]|nr:hypothetical protein [Pirellulales bacterium]
MSHPLEQQIAALRSRVRRLLTLYGLCWTLGAAVAAVILLGAADYAIRFEDRGIRVLASAAVLSVLVWAAYRNLYFGLTTRMTDVELARRLECRFPVLRDSLASAVEFLRQSEEDPLAGSVAMRRAMIAKTAAEIEPLDLNEAVDRRPAVRAAMTATAIGLLALILIVANPLASGIAIARLANPFGDTAWPRTTHLVLRNYVDRVARGQTFEVEVIDADGNLPAEVFIHYRFENAEGKATSESERMRLLGGAMVARRDNVVRPFSYRVTGGDDHSMPWIDVEVLLPPALESASITLVPPEYTAWPKEAAKDHIRALAGTRVTIAARATKPLKAAQLCLEDGRRFDGRVTGDGRYFTIPADPRNPVGIEKSGAYWFEFTDTEGLTGGSDDRWEIRAVPDASPTVAIEEPAANIFVTPEATVPLRVTAKDDLAVRGVALEFHRSDQADAPASTLPLYAGPAQAAAQAQGVSDSGRLGETRVVTYPWTLAGLKLTPGLQITFRASANDYLPQTAKSDERRLAIITPEELTQRLATRQALILAELARVLQMQRESRQQVADLEIQVRQVGKLGQLGVDHLRGAELNQRQVNTTLTSRSDGVPMHIAGVLADLQNNKVDSPDILRQMEALLAEIDRLAQEHLPVIGHELTAAGKIAQVELEAANAQGRSPEQTQADQSLAASLGAAGKHQDKVIESLEKMLGELSRWDHFRRFHRDASQLLRDQEELNGRTTDLGRRTLAKKLNDLPPQDLADLKIRARQQSELGRRLDRLQQDMALAVEQLQQNDPLSAETIDDALARARELVTSGKMRTASGEIEGNQMGQAMSRQQEIVEDLNEILDILANRREHELGRLVKRFREAESALSHLAQRQDALKKEMEQAAVRSDEAERRRQLEQLGRRQQQVQEETERIARRLERLMAQQPSQKTQQAAGAMQQACQAAEQGDAKSACQQAETAKKSLDEAARQLAERRRQAEAELAMEQLERLQDAVKALGDRQQRILDETRRLDELQRTHGRLTRAQAISLQDLTREQSAVRGETAALAEKLTGAEVVHLALTGAAGEMGQAAAMLDRQETGRPTQQVQQQAQARLGMLLEVLKPEQPEQKKDDGGGGGQGRQGGDPSRAMQALVELKLMKLMQVGINRRTQDLENLFGQAEKLDENALREYEQLSAEQGRLAELLLGLVPEDDSQDVPEPSPETPEQSP